MRRQHIEEPLPARYLFGNTHTAWFWLVVRVYVGWEWLHAGWGKVQSEKWIGSQSGQALTGFLKGALAKTQGEHPDVQGWYADFLQNVVMPNASIWAHAIAWGEVAVGVALILGALTGIAAFFGLFMNLNFLLAGTVSTNPILFVLSIGLVLAWRVAGYIGADRYVLPLLGTPWQPGSAFGKNKLEI